MRAQISRGLCSCRADHPTHKPASYCFFFKKKRKNKTEVGSLRTDKRWITSQQTTRLFALRCEKNVINQSTFLTNMNNWYELSDQFRRNSVWTRTLLFELNWKKNTKSIIEEQKKQNTVCYLLSTIHVTIRQFCNLKKKKLKKFKFTKQRNRNIRMSFGFLEKVQIEQSKHCRSALRHLFFINNIGMIHRIQTKNSQHFTEESIGDVLRGKIKSKILNYRIEKYVHNTTLTRPSRIRAKRSQSVAFCHSHQP